MPIANCNWAFEFALEFQIVQSDEQAIYSSGAEHDRNSWFSIMFRARFDSNCFAVQLSGNLNATSASMQCNATKIASDRRR